MLPLSQEGDEGDSGSWGPPGPLLKSLVVGLGEIDEQRGDPLESWAVAHDEWPQLGWMEE